MCGQFTLTLLTKLPIQIDSPFGQNRNGTQIWSAGNLTREAHTRAAVNFSFARREMIVISLHVVCVCVSSVCTDIGMFHYFAQFTVIIAIRFHHSIVWATNLKRQIVIMLV